MISIRLPGFYDSNIESMENIRNFHVGLLTSKILSSLYIRYFPNVREIWQRNNHLFLHLDSIVSFEVVLFGNAYRNS